MFRRISVLLLALAFASSARGAETVPISLIKTSRWEVNYDKEACHLLSKFGTGKQATIVRLTRYAPTSSFDLTLFGELFATREAVRKIEVDFGLGHAIKRDALAGTIGNKLPMLLLGSTRIDGLEPTDTQQLVPRITPEQEASATAISFKLLGGKRYRLESGSLAPPLAALRKCVDDLVTTWGFDPAQQAALQEPAVPLTSPSFWLQGEDYPAGSLYRGENGVVTFRLTVAANGSLESCHILYRTNPDKFADLTCKLLAKRARFHPAIDAQGNKVRSLYINSVHWLASK